MGRSCHYVRVFTLEAYRFSSKEVLFGVNLSASWYYTTKSTDNYSAATLNSSLPRCRSHVVSISVFPDAVGATVVIKVLWAENIDCMMCSVQPKKFPQCTWSSMIQHISISWKAKHITYGIQPKGLPRLAHQHCVSHKIPSFNNSLCGNIGKYLIFVVDNFVNCTRENEIKVSVQPTVDIKYAVTSYVNAFYVFIQRAP